MSGVGDIMYKGIYIDDEPWAIQGFLKTLQWESRGIEISHTFMDPLEALEQIEDIKPDVIFTDIKMTGMNGIELVKKLRDKGIDSRIVLVSGYADFEYAQKAIDYNVFSYILKPIDNEELESVVNSLLKHLGEEKQEEHQEDEKFIEAVHNKDGQKVEKILLERGLDLADKDFMAIMVSCWDYEKGKLDLLLSKYKHLRFKFGSNKYLYVLSQASDAKDYLTATIKSYNRDSEHPIHMGCSKLFMSLKKVVYYIAQSDVALSSDYFDSDETLFFYEEHQPEVAKDLYCILIRDLEGEGNGITSYGSEIMSKGLTMVDVAFIYNKVITYFHEKRDIHPLAHDFQCMSYDQLYKTYKDINHMYHYLRKSIQLVQDKAVDVEGKEAFDTFKRITDYMEEHYAQTMSLEEVSKKLYINPTYICDLFKRYSQHTFSQHRTEVRMKHAYNMVANSSMSLAQISEAIGYNDYYYFNKVFKKRYKITPTRLRQGDRVS